MLDTTAATEGETDHTETTMERMSPDRSVRDEFETIWRIAGLPPCHLSRYPDGTYKAGYAAHAWANYAATREWRAVLRAAKSRG